MKKKLILYSVLYYCLIPAVFRGIMLLLSALLSITKSRDNIGAVIIAALVFLYVAIPVVDAVLMRFSPLRFYVDPFAAAECPLFMYLALIISRLRSTDSVRNAFLIVNQDLADDYGMGFFILTGLFIIGVLFSLSIKRRYGQSIAYRIINKTFQKRPAETGASKHNSNSADGLS